MRRVIIGGCAMLTVGLALAGCGDDDGGNQNHVNNNNESGICGDGELDPGEECDQGESNSDSTPDACRSDCRNPYCGDAVQDTGEDCDDGDDGHNGTDGCPNTCLAPVCGDGHILDGVEACDDGNTEDGDDCRSDCGQLLTDCGNGLPDQGEECDEGTSNSDTAPNRCRKSCQFPSCGDGVTDDDYDEECDDASGLSDTAPNACRLDCTLPICGDGVTDDAAPFNESCDGSDLGGATCQTELAEAGQLACTSGCAFDYGGCHGCGNGDCERALGENETNCAADCAETDCADGNDNDLDGAADCGDPDCAGASCGSGATCQGGTCCAGCWDGSACQVGNSIAVCGGGGAACADCEDNNPCTTDSCAGSCDNQVLGDGTVPTGYSGRCYGGQLCTGCYNQTGATCETGSSAGMCGVNGDACFDCSPQNECEVFLGCPNGICEFNMLDGVACPTTPNCTCRSGTLCTGCWDSSNSTCLSGDTPEHCGIDGAICTNCDDGNPGTTDTCTATGQCESS